MKRIRSIAVAALAVLVAAVYVLPIAPAVAVSDDSAASSALSIAPKKQYEINAGKTVDDKLTIRNVDKSTALQLTLRVIDFTFDEAQDSGVAKLYLDPSAEPTPWSLRSHIKLPETVTIGPGETKTVDMSVSIPANQGAGSLYSAIIYSSGGGDASGSGGSGASGSVGLNASGVTLVFANVPGKVHQDLQLENLGPYDKSAKKYMPYITTAMPDSIGYTLKNNGNWAESPVGSITVNGWFGRKIEINDINPTKSLVLIGQSRTFSSCLKFDEKEVANTRSNTPPTTCVDPGLWPGYYSVTANLFYGANGNETREIIKTVGFWYLPWWFIALCIVVFGVAFYYGRKVYIKVRTALYGPQRTKRKSSRRS